MMSRLSTFPQPGRGGVGLIVSVPSDTMTDMVDRILHHFAPHIRIIRRRPAPHIPAATDGLHIWVDPRMNQTEYRCAVMHELVHIGYGHTTCQPALVEARVRAVTAKLLVPFDTLVESWRWATTINELADELHVTRLVLEDRLDELTFKQQQALAAINFEIGKTL